MYKQSKWIAAIVTFTLAASLQAQERAVLVELFTSEGCSSCPPADALLGQVNGSRTSAGLLVVGLSEHVTYWNQFGWSDPYSSPIYTDRQNAYGQRFQLDGVYTPQMIVNGGAGFVGSDSGQAEKGIAAALAQATRVSVQLRAVGVTVQGHVTVEYTIGQDAIGKTLNLALAERGIERRIGKGENAGKVLRHENVVRAFESVHVEGANGKVELPAPADAVRKEIGCV